VREVIFSRVKEETFQDLVTEFRASGPELRLLRQTVRVDEALQLIRHHRSRTQTLIYFYVVDAASRLSGVLQTRALVAVEPEERLSEIMIQRVVAIPDTATVLDACEFFVLHKSLHSRSSIASDASPAWWT